MEKYNKDIDFALLINKYFGSNYVYNSLKSPLYYSNLHRDKQLEIVKEESYLLLFEKRHSHKYMNYFISKSVVDLPHISGKCVTEFAYRNETQYRNNRDILNAMGFSEGMSRLCYRLDLKNLPLKKCKPLETAEQKDGELIKRAIDKSFHVDFGCIPSFKYIEEKVQLGEIVLLYMEDSIVGLVEYSINKNIATIDHILILEEYRGKSYSKILIERFVYLMKKNGIIFIDLWVDKLNYKAIEIYEKANFQRKGLFSSVLINKECKDE